MRSKNTLLPLAMVVAVGLSGASASATSIAARHDVGKITVKAQGVRKDERFALVFTRESGSIAGWYDLHRDPDMSVNLGAVGKGNAFALFQNRADVVVDGEQVAVRPGPARRFEVTESNDVRVIVEVRGELVDRTGRPPKMQMKRRLEMTLGQKVHVSRTPRYATRFTIYPTGRVYIRHVWTLQNNTVTLASNRVILGTAPTDEVVAMNDHGSGRDALKNPACFILHHGAGRTFNRDILLISDRRRYRTDWLGQTMALRGRCGWTRSGFSLQDKKRLLRPGLYVWKFLLQVGPSVLKDPEAAAPYVADYMNPAVLSFPEKHGRRRLEEPEDLNLDGFVASRGCYVMTASRRGGVTFTLDAREHARYQPAFEVHDWRGGAPGSMRLDGRRIRLGTDYSVHLAENVLRFQYLGVLKPGVHAFAVQPPVGRQRPSG